MKKLSMALILGAITMRGCMLINFLHDFQAQLVLALAFFYLFNFISQQFKDNLCKRCISLCDWMSKNAFISRIWGHFFYTLFLFQFLWNFTKSFITQGKGIHVRDYSGLP